MAILRPKMAPPPSKNKMQDSMLRVCPQRPQERCTPFTRLRSSSKGAPGRCGLESDTVFDALLDFISQGLINWELEPLATFCRDLYRRAAFQRGLGYDEVVAITDTFCDDRAPQCAHDPSWLSNVSWCSMPMCLICALTMPKSGPSSLPVAWTA